MDSKIPKSEISLRKESMRVGLADLRRTSIFSGFFFSFLAVELKGCKEKDSKEQWGKELPEFTHNSTMQLLVLMSNTFPPN